MAPVLHEIVKAELNLSPFAGLMHRSQLLGLACFIPSVGLAILAQHSGFCTCQLHSRSDTSRSPGLVNSFHCAPAA